MRCAHNAEFQGGNQPLQFFENFRRITTDELGMEGNPHCSELLLLSQLTKATKTVQIAREAEIQGTLCVGMLVQTPEQRVLFFLIKLDFPAEPEINTAFEILLRQEQSLICVCRRYECR